MLNENAKKWLKALRSGKFAQGTTSLHCKGRFCAIGVACELASKVDKSIVKSNTHFTGEVSYNGKTCIPPREVRNWIGLTSSGEDKVMNLNDAERKTFAEIADAIEANPEEYFA